MMRTGHPTIPRMEQTMDGMKDGKTESGPPGMISAKAGTMTSGQGEAATGKRRNLLGTAMPIKETGKMIKGLSGLTPHGPTEANGIRMRDGGISISETSVFKVASRPSFHLQRRKSRPAFLCILHSAALRSVFKWQQKRRRMHAGSSTPAEPEHELQGFLQFAF